VTLQHPKQLTIVAPNLDYSEVKKQPITALADRRVALTVQRRIDIIPRIAEAGQAWPLGSLSKIRVMPF